MSDAPPNFPLPPINPNTAPQPTPAEIGASLPFTASQANQILDGAKNSGDPDHYARALRFAAEDGYALSAEHAKALAGLPKEAARSDGFPPAAPGSEAEAFDRSGLAPAKSPADYNTAGLASELAGMTEAEYAGADAALRHVLFDMRVPASIGGSVAKLGVQSANGYQNLDASGRELWAAEQRAQLARMHPNIAEVTAKVDRLVEAVGDRQAVEVLARNGFFSAPVITLLAAHYDRMQLRMGMK